MNVDFIRIAGQPVRVTSLKADDATGALTLVVIARGSVDRQQLSGLLEASPVKVEIGDVPARPMAVASVDQRTSGSGEAAIARFAIELVPVHEAEQTAAASNPDLGARLDRIEATLNEILAILKRGSS